MTKKLRKAKRIVSLSGNRKNKYKLWIKVLIFIKKLVMLIKKIYVENIFFINNVSGGIHDSRQKYEDWYYF
jgi:hypothetical protein